MNNRFFATLIVVCLAFAGGGCASEAQRKKYEEGEVLLPRQTGSLLSRRMNQEPDHVSKPKKKKHEETKPPAKKTAKKTEPTEPEKPKEPKAPKPEPTPEEPTAQPDRFR